MNKNKEISKKEIKDTVLIIRINSMMKKELSTLAKTQNTNSSKKVNDLIEQYIDIANLLNNLNK
jgi:predicted DNA-binding protein